MFIYFLRLSTQPRTKKSFLEFSPIGGFHATSSPSCWWTVNKRPLISSLCLSTSICSFHYCYLCIPRLHENHLLIAENVEKMSARFEMFSKSHISQRCVKKKKCFYILDFGIQLLQKRKIQKQKKA